MSTRHREESSVDPIRRAARPWLVIEDGGEQHNDAVQVRVLGSAASTDRSDELWTSLEAALQEAVGRLVIIDVTRVTGFDVDTLDTLARVSRAARRWHLDLCAVVRPGSALDQYARFYGLDATLPMFSTLREALAWATVRASV